MVVIPGKVPDEQLESLGRRRRRRRRRLVVRSRFGDGRRRRCPESGRRRNGLVESVVGFFVVKVAFDVGVEVDFVGLGHGDVDESLSSFESPLSFFKSSEFSDNGKTRQRRYLLGTSKLGYSVSGYFVPKSAQDVNWRKNAPKVLQKSAEVLQKSAEVLQKSA